MVVFHHCDKVALKRQFKGKKDLIWVAVSELRVHGHWSSSVTQTMMEAQEEAKLFISRWIGSKETKSRAQVHPSRPHLQ